MGTPLTKTQGKENKKKYEKEEKNMSMSKVDGREKESKGKKREKSR